MKSSGQARLGGAPDTVSAQHPQKELSGSDSENATKRSVFRRARECRAIGPAHGRPGQGISLPFMYLKRGPLSQPGSELTRARGDGLAARSSG